MWMWSGVESNCPLTTQCRRSSLRHRPSRHRPSRHRPSRHRPSRHRSSRRLPASTAPVTGRVTRSTGAPASISSLRPPARRCTSTAVRPTRSAGCGRAPRAPSGATLPTAADSLTAQPPSRGRAPRAPSGATLPTAADSLTAQPPSRGRALPAPSGCLDTSRW